MVLSKIKSGIGWSHLVPAAFVLYLIALPLIFFVARFYSTSTVGIVSPVQYLFFFSRQATVYASTVYECRVSATAYYIW
ncbi:hypothetical protein FC093_11210 [Ilyomonas limi]|uniref:Uncharacterized protein n=1 Tax=Ilyomonas limi TaxID=2575867 RepID=A0A4U3L3T0_9BACT|nr:hypothetical protein [Ilyomonas limi]TKK68197.1 hypothetical protein FC093_11210 [Ilyomonas limi]